MMHPACVPPPPARTYDKMLGSLLLFIRGWSKLRNFERADVNPIGGMTVLREPKETIAACHDPARRTGDVRIPLADWAAGMFLPRSGQVGCMVESQGIEFVPCSFRKEPPVVTVAED